MFARKKIFIVVKKIFFTELSQNGPCICEKKVRKKAPFSNFLGFMVLVFCHKN